MVSLNANDLVRILIQAFDETSTPNTEHVFLYSAGAYSVLRVFLLFPLEFVAQNYCTTLSQFSGVRLKCLVTLPQW